MREITSLILISSICILVFELVRPSKKVRDALVIAAGILFLYYGYQSWLGVALICAWAAAAFFLGNLLWRKPTFGKVIVPAAGAILVALFYGFKSGTFSAGHKNVILDAAVPLGFSFLLFYSFAFLVDMSRKRFAPPGPLRFFSGILFFPTLIVGPFHKLGPEEEPLAELRFSRFQGYAYFCLGTFKFAFSGVLLKPYFLSGLPLQASHFAVAPHPANLFLLSSLYLYANFSGFSDMVVGLSRLLEREVPPNFRLPFLSSSPAEYWRRWHASLGAWLREYVFFPLHYRLASLGPRAGFLSARADAIALFIAFLLLALWHGITLKYAVYGIINWGLVYFFRPSGNHPWLATSIVFLEALFTNALFLSKNLESFFELLLGVFGAQEGNLTWSAHLRTTLFCAAFIALFHGADALFLGLTEESALRVRLGAQKHFAVCFLLCAGMLSLGLILGIGATDVVYMGY